MHDGDSITPAGQPDPDKQNTRLNNKLKAANPGLAEIAQGHVVDYTDACQNDFRGYVYPN